MSNISKYLSLFFIISYTLATLTQLKLGGWKDMSEDQKMQLGSLLSTNDMDVTVKEGKLQLVNGINYAVVLSANGFDDCFTTFTHISYDKSNPISKLELSSQIKDQFVGALDGIKICEENDSNILLSGLNPSMDEEKSEQSHHDDLSLDINQISERSDPDELQEPQLIGGWQQMDQFDLNFLKEQMEGLNPDDDVEFQSGIMQMVTGMNYMITIKVGDSAPCVLAFNYVSWNKDLKFTPLSEELITSGDLLSLVNFTELCSDELQTEKLSVANQNILPDQKQMKQIIKESWNDLDESQIQVLVETLPLSANKLTIVDIPKVHKLNEYRISMLIQGDSIEECVLFVLLDVNNDLVSFDDSSNEFNSTALAKFYSDKQPCDVSFVKDLGNSLDERKDFMRLVEMFFLQEKKALGEIKQDFNFADWNMLNLNNIMTVYNVLKAQDKPLKPVFGLSKIDKGMSYILIMRDNFLFPCSMYVNYSNYEGSKTIIYSSLKDHEDTQDLLQHIDPCEEDLVSNFVDKSSVKFLI